MTRDGQQWRETTIAGLQVRNTGVDGDIAGMRLLGWPGVVPVSVIRAVGLTPAADGGTLRPPARLGRALT
ncbi:hypothetical protein [Streptomyces sp. NPDC006334]|uniref:hypothetical protein n=1 Tax=Streptomyces sp. NPDC006334 TaxID=3156754 RepID=UPI0033A9C397